jgi:hypothetical protein
MTQQLNLKMGVAFFAMLLFGMACSQDPDLKLARHFLDAYFVMADHDAALKISSGQALEQLKKEQELLKGVSPNSNADAYRSRDITFKLDRETKNESEANFLYRLKIIVPDLEDQEKIVLITVDRQAHKIKAFTSM